MVLESPEESGGRRDRARSSVRASEGRWSPRGCCCNEKIELTLCSGERENFRRRKALRSLYSMGTSPLLSSHWAICGNRASGRAART